MRFKILPFIAFLLVCQTGFAQKLNERQFQQLEKAADRYQRLLGKDEWVNITLTDKPVLKLNDTSDVIPLISERLELLGDLRRARSTNIYTEKLENAVKQFQIRHGIEDDGVIGPAVIKTLNISLEKRIEQLTVNMNRIKVDTVDMTGTRIVANIPGYRLYVFEDSKEVLSMDIVVGKISNQTEIFSDTLENIVFSPYWNIPASIVRNEILPNMNKNSSYLKKNNMEITGKLDGLPTIRQKPGPENSLGAVKFLFPNQHNIYFHDTPAKSLFDRKSRAFSHGCIRLSQPFELAKYLLKDQPEWTDEEITKAMHAGKEKWVKLVTQIPVSIIYYTAWVDRDGLLNFRDDIYGLDQQSASF
jgi:murein L,D-transpeptidase YcbB/YkuD